MDPLLATKPVEGILSEPGPNLTLGDAIRNYLNNHPKIYERLRQEWLNRQDWYKELNQRALGSGSMSSVMDPKDKPPVSLYGEVRKAEDGLWKGGGGIGLNFPLDPLSSIRFSAGGGGAYGTIQTPLGPAKVRTFFPEAAIGYKREF